MAIEIGKPVESIPGEQQDSLTAKYAALFYNVKSKMGSFHNGEALPINCSTPKETMGALMGLRYMNKKNKDSIKFSKRGLTIYASWNR